MAPVEQHRCVPGGCIVGKGNLTSVQNLKSDLGETVSLLQLFAHRYSFLAAPGLGASNILCLTPKIDARCNLYKKLFMAVNRIGASIAVARCAVNK